MSDLNAIEQKLFNGGMNTFASDDTVAQNEVREMVNMKVNVRQNALEQAGGSEYTISPTTQDDSNVVINSVYRFYLSTGTAFSLAHYTTIAPASENQVFVFDETTPEGDLDWTVAMTSPVTDYAVFQNNVYLVNGQGRVFPWDGDTGAMAGLASTVLPTIGATPFAATLIEMYQGRAHYAGDPVNPSMVIVSEPSDPEAFQSPFVQPKYLINESDGDKITSLKVLGGNLIVFKQNSFYIVEGALPRRTSQHPSVGVGALSDKTVQKTQLGLVFLARTGVYLYNGSNLILISRKITNELRSAILEASGEFSSAYQNNVYYLFYKPASKSFINEGFSFDMNEVEFGGSEIAISKLVNWRVGGSFVQSGSTDNNEWYGFQDDTGNIIRLNTPGVQSFYNDSLTTFNICPQVQTRWLDADNRAIEKEFRVVYIFTHQPIVQATMEVEFERDGDGTFQKYTLDVIGGDPDSPGFANWDTAIWDSSVWDSGSGVFRYRVDLPPGIFANRLRLRFFSDKENVFLNIDRLRVHFRGLRER